LSFQQIYINASIHVALAVTSFSGVTYLEFDRTASVPLLLCTFFGTIVAYNGIKYLPVYQQIRQKSNKGFPLAVGIISAVSLVSASVSVFYVDSSLIPALGVIGIITAAYALPVNRRFKNLRQVYGIKIIVIGFVWAAVTVILPLMEAGLKILNHPEAIATIVQRFLFVIVLTIPFDIRDRSADPDYLGTLPMILGTRRAIGFGFLLLMGVVLIEFLFRSGLNTSLVVFSAVITTTGLMLYRSSGRQSPWLAAFWIEGIPIFWLVIYLLSNWS
jgi:hypothetical protein